MLFSKIIAYLRLPRTPVLKWVFYYYLINLPIFWLLGCRYFISSSLPHDVFGIAFVSTAILGHFATFSLLLVLIPNLLLTLLWPKKPLIMPLAIFGTLFIIAYLSVDASVFMTYRFHLNGVLLQMIFSSAFAQVFSFSWFEWLLAGLYVLFIIVLEIFLAMWLHYKTARIQRNRYAVIGFILILCCYLANQGIYAWNSAAYMYQGSSYAQSTINASEKLPLYYGLTAKNFLLGHNFIIPQANNNMAIANLSANNQDTNLLYPLHPITANASKKPLNVMLIVLDTWRFDMLTQATSPNIYNFAQHAWQFTYHYSGGDATEPGIFSLFYGVPSSYWSSFVAAHRGPVLIDELLKQHYQLAIYASASLYKPDFYQTAFINVPNLRIENPQPEPWQRDEYINQEMISFLKHRNPNKPFFGFLFYDAIHEYDFPPTFKTPFNPWWKTINHLALNNNFNPTQYINRYKNSIIFVDSLVKQIFETLQQQQLMDNTVIIITADHGEEFNDNHKNYWGHGSNFSHIQEQTPFIVYWPKQPATVYQHFTSHYDVVPLLMQKVLGVTNPTRDYSIGQPLTTPGNREVIPVSSYVFNGFVEYKADRITTLLGGGLYRVTNDKLDPIERGKGTNVQDLQTVFEMMHRYYQ